MERHLLEFEGHEIELIFLTRLDWEAGPVTVGHPLDLDRILRWHLHHTVFLTRDFDGDGYVDGDLDDIRRYMQILQSSRPDLGNEVPYPYLSFRGGHENAVVVVEGRGHTRTGAHTACNNSTSLAWAIPGNSDTEELTRGQIAGMRWIANRLTPNITNPARGHQHAPPCWSSDGRTNYNATACPGADGVEQLPRLQPPYLPLTPTDWFTMATKEELEEIVERKTREVVQEELGGTNLKILNLWNHLVWSLRGSLPKPDEDAREFLGLPAPHLTLRWNLRNKIELGLKKWTEPVYEWGKAQGLWGGDD